MALARSKILLAASIIAVTIVLVEAFASTGVVSSAAAADTRIVALNSSDLVYDPIRQRLYASVPESGAGTTGTIAVIDPVSGTVEGSLSVGSKPGKLALSGDGSYLYVALDGPGAVVRVNLSTMVSDQEFLLGADSFFGPYYAEDMAVLPGDPDAVAVSRKNLGISPRHAGVAIYRNGVQLPNATARHAGSNVIESAPTSSMLYGYNNETTEFGFRRMAVDGSGISVLDVTRDLITGFSVDIAWDGGLIYGTDGKVIDPEWKTLVWNFSEINYASAVRPDSAAGRVFFLDPTSYSGTYRLMAFDIRTHALVGSMDVTGVQGSGSPSSLVRWGSDGLAFRTAGGQLFLIQGPLVSGEPVPTSTPYPTKVPTSTPTPVPTNTPTPVPTNTPTPVPVSYLHVGDLDGAGKISKSNWTGTVTITVHDGEEKPLEGATVNGSWSGGYKGTAWCTTGTDGQCSIPSPAISKKNGALTFNVNGVSLGSYVYRPGDNHDPDGGSSGTAITILRP